MMTKTDSIEKLIETLEAKDTSEAFNALKEMENMSEQSDVFYPYIERFAEMTSSDKYVIRVRGFRLFCKQARWDVDYHIDENIDMVLKVLNDEKPTAVRQALAALPEIVKYKPDLADIIRNAVKNIKYGSYKDSMQGLILKDMQVVIRELDDRQM